MAAPPHSPSLGGAPATGRPVEAPATGATLGRVPDLDAAAVGRLAAAGRRAQPPWEALGFAGRAAVMRAFRAWLVRHRARVIETIVAETGKAHEDALAV